MPQTRFVLSKAFECGLRPIVVINKIDRPDARSHEVVDEVLELFLQLGADDASGRFPLYVRQCETRLRHDRSDSAHETSIHAADGHDSWRRSRAGRRVGRTATDAGHHARLVRLRGPHRHRPCAVGHDPQGAKRGPRCRQTDRITPTKAVSPFMSFEDLGRVEVHEVDAGDICADCRAGRRGDRRYRGSADRAPSATCRG